MNVSCVHCVCVCGGGLPRLVVILAPAWSTSSNVWPHISQLVLLPRVTELPGFHGNDPAAVERREELERYTCLEAFRMATMPDLAEMCARLLCSISALMHDGALRK